MRYRPLDQNGDYTISRTWLVDSPEAVAQAIQTRLGLFAGEWFLDNTDGTPYSTEVLGRNTVSTYDLAIRERILDTPGVTEIIDYASVLTPDRHLTISATVATQYGTATLTSTL